MTERKGTIDEIRKLYRAKLGRRRGVVMRAYEDTEVGIRTYNFDVLTQDGVFSGYWTDPEPEFAERTIVSRIIATEDCQEWDTLDDDELGDCLEFLRQYQHRR